MNKNLEINLVKYLKKYRKKYPLISSENKEEVSNDLLNKLQPKKVYYSVNSANFSVGFISLIAGLVIVGGGGIAYSLSRPCVLDSCDLITVTENNINDSLTNINPNYTEEELLILASIINQNIQQLKTIPAWSKHHQNAQNLITEYQIITNDINYLVEAEKQAISARQMSSKLPLSVAEWEQVEDIWRRALASKSTVKSPVFAELKNNKNDDYNAELTLVQYQKNQAILAENLLSEAEVIAKENQILKDNIESLADLENLSLKWQEAINKIKGIDDETKPAPLKPELTDRYVQELNIVKERIKQEENAQNIYQQAQTKVKEAQDSENNNQWTNAVKNWREVEVILAEFSPESLLKNDMETLQKEAKEKLVLAEKELKLAINREKAKQELTRVCQSSEKICDYLVENKTIKVFLHPQYLTNVATIAQISTTNENAMMEALINHINQVEKNYRYISSKYDFTLEIYNAQQKLILVYN
ncbi:MAG: hypothetical protein IGQ45_07740 [Cyanobacterium sp. T60_A2020_053]|nr:hypothetical protein [Cyanobacterium sp. T60_A2020_053]